MTGSELQAAGIKLFGQRGWQSSLAARLEIDRTQIWRYVTENRVPGPVAAAVELMVAMLGLREESISCLDPRNGTMQVLYEKSVRNFDGVPQSSNCFGVPYPTYSISGLSRDKAGVDEVVAQVVGMANGLFSELLDRLEDPAIEWRKRPELTVPEEPVTKDMPGEGEVPVWVVNLRFRCLTHSATHDELRKTAAVGGAPT